MDAFHSATIDGDRFVAALRAAADNGASAVVQVLDRPDDVAQVEDLLVRAFGAGWSAYADLNRLVPLPYGRGASVFARPAPLPARSLGSCRVAATPVVRYDGAVTACCNEELIVGHRPDRLRERHSTGTDVVDALERIWADPFLRLLNASGTAALTAYPRYADLADQSCRGICDFCRHAQQRTPALGEDTDRVLAGLAGLAEAAAGSAVNR
jgi:hypothetical protein